MNSGLIFRLVDIALITLFGFIAISDIQMKRQIRLPGASAESKSVQEPGSAFLVTRIDPEGSFAVSMEDQPLLRTADTQELAVFLAKTVRDLRVKGRNAVVIIDPDAKATVQRTIDVFDICEREQLPKSINLQIFVTSQELGERQ